jgi:hypothetical protein
VLRRRGGLAIMPTAAPVSGRSSEGWPGLATESQPVPILLPLEEELFEKQIADAPQPSNPSSRSTWLVPTTPTSPHRAIRSPNRNLDSENLVQMSRVFSLPPHPFLSPAGRERVLSATKEWPQFGNGSVTGPEALIGGGRATSVLDLCWTSHFLLIRSQVRVNGPFGYAYGT